MNISLFRDPPVAPGITGFFGRDNELKNLYECITSSLPINCVVIGETYIGKTALLCQLAEGKAAPPEMQDRIIVYFDAMPRPIEHRNERASLHFWQGLYQAAHKKIADSKQKTPPFREASSQNPAEATQELKSELEQLLGQITRQGHKRIIFALDNFEGIANLPLRDSIWLRSLADTGYCSFIVSTRHLLRILYHQENPGYSSPLWSLFSEYLYLGLMEEDEILEFLTQQESEKFWRPEDIKLIRRFAGRHPALVKIAVSLLLKVRKQSRHPLTTEKLRIFEFEMYRVSSPICNQLWFGLADPELMGIAWLNEYPKTQTRLSLHQQAVAEVAKGNTLEDNTTLFELEQRGLIEQVNGRWQIFSEVMRLYVERQEQAYTLAGMSFTGLKGSRTQEPTTQSDAEINIGRLDRVHPPRIENETSPVFTYLEGKVYSYLQAHVGEVCDKDAIKRSVWGKKTPTDSTLQKIIERIRKKIELDPDNPRHLVAVRGQGYILREA